MIILKDLEKQVTPIDVEFVDVIFLSSYNVGNETSSNICHYIVRSISDKKLYLVDANLHTTVNPISNMSYNNTREVWNSKTWKIKVNRFLADDNFSNILTNDYVSFNIKGKLYIKESKSNNKIKSGKWVISEPVNTRFEDDCIICEMGEIKKSKWRLLKEHAYRFNDKVSFEELKDINIVEGYAKF